MATHGLQSTYSSGCRCRTEDGLFRAPQEGGCTEAWREYRRDRERVRRAQPEQREAQRLKAQARRDRAKAARVAAAENGAG